MQNQITPPKVLHCIHTSLCFFSLWLLFLYCPKTAELRSDPEEAITVEDGVVLVEAAAGAAAAVAAALADLEVEALAVAEQGGSGNKNKNCTLAP